VLRTPAICVCAVACSTAPVTTHKGERPPLSVTRGDLHERVVVSGELDAADSSKLAVPRTRNWQIPIRFIAKDGEPVKKGDRLMEFDNSAVTQRLRELELGIIRAANALVSQRASDSIDLADKELAVEQQRIEVAKAAIDVKVPASLISRRKWQDNQLALERAEKGHASAVGAHAAAKRGAALEEKVKRIDYEKAERNLERAEKQLDKLVLTAPHDGVLLVADHPWFGRRLQVGDTVQPGMEAVQISSSETMKVVAQLSDIDDGRIAVGMTTECVLDAYPAIRHAGTVASISEIAREPSQNSLRRFFQVEVRLDKTDTKTMRPGMSVRVDVLAREVTGAVIAPRAGLVIDGSKAQALLAGGGERAIEIEFCTPQACAVRSGLEAGERLRYRDGPR